MAKLGLTSRRESVSSTLYTVLDESLRLLHPMIPFVTEEIWQKLPKGQDAPESIVIAPWPAADTARIDEEAERDMALLQEIVTDIRRFRHEHRIAPRKLIDAVVQPGEAAAKLVDLYADELKALASLSSISAGEQPDGWSSVVAGGAEIFLPLGELTDVGAERERLEREIAETTKRAEAANAKLANPKFVSGAPADVVEKVRSQLAEHNERVAILRSQLEELGS
jgi:valyl-tRNA synthetase